MSGNYSAEEVKQQHVDAMGDELGGLYHALWNELAWVESKWAEYVELYGKKESRIKLLNQAAAHFFRIVQDSLWDDTILHIARLTDPPKSVGKDNLTIRRLPLFLADEGIKSKVVELLGIVEEKTSFCRDRRNRRLAHRDFGLAMKSGVEPLLPASRALVREALDSIAAVLNAVSSNFMDSTTIYNSPITSNGAISLLYVIDDGIRAEEERMQRRKSGNYSADDFGARGL